TTPGAVNFHTVENAWSEKTINFGNAPVMSLATDQFTVDAANSFVSFEATKLVQAAVRNRTSVGVALTPVGATEVFFDSKESTSTSQVAALDIELTGPAGPQGIPGPQGLTGAPGAPGPTGSSAVVGNFSSFQVADTEVPAFSEMNKFLSCPTGYPNLVSGGCGWPFLSNTVRAGSSVRLFYSGPDPNQSDSVWMCSVGNGTGVTQILKTYVNCAR
ncbi:MAG: DNRLRE domain-containing protein, partial [Bryobacteraceae bacterium]|nr:DNRLRE domain-containing protein [Bryobacteraceae bacterium]